MKQRIKILYSTNTLFVNRKKEDVEMSTLTEKELSTIKDLLSAEELLVKKFKMLAEHADKMELKNQMESIAKKHQGHFDELYQKLS